MNQPPAHAHGRWAQMDGVSDEELRDMTEILLQTKKSLLKGALPGPAETRGSTVSTSNLFISTASTSWVRSYSDAWWNASPGDAAATVAGRPCFLASCHFLITPEEAFWSSAGLARATSCLVKSIMC